MGEYLDNTETVNNDINSLITEQEIEKAIHQLKNNKSGGVDEIVNEQIKFLNKS